MSYLIVRNFWLQSKVAQVTKNVKFTQINGASYIKVGWLNV